MNANKNELKNQVPFHFSYKCDTNVRFYCSNINLKLLEFSYSEGRYMNILCYQCFRRCLGSNKNVSTWFKM